MFHILVDMNTGIFTLCMANRDGTLTPFLIFTEEYFKRHLTQCQEALADYQKHGTQLLPRIRSFIDDLKMIDQIKDY